MKNTLQTESVDGCGNAINLEGYWRHKMVTTLNMEYRRERLPIGASVYVLDADIYGILTRITKAGICWIKVSTRGGNHHHAVKDRTLRFPIELVVPDCRGIIERNTNKGN